MNFDRIEFIGYSKKYNKTDNPAWQVHLLMDKEHVISVEVELVNTSLIIYETDCIPFEEDQLDELLSKIISYLIMNNQICSGEDGDYYYLQQEDYIIYQLPIEHPDKFRSEINTDLSDYTKVYSGSIAKDITEYYEKDLELCELIFKKFNTDHPEDFKGHSLSVSDVVMLISRDEKVARAYRCDDYGWDKLEVKGDSYGISIESSASN